MASPEKNRHDGNIQNKEAALRKKNFERVCILLVVAVMLFSIGYAHAADFGVGVHGGYGVLKYEENVSRDDTTADKSRATLNTILLGVSGEYTFPQYKNFFAGIVTDWAVGLKDREEWEKNGEKIQTNDISTFGQFYDGRLGYKNSIGNLSYRIYISGGWDGIHFRRKNFVVNGVTDHEAITEDFSLWRIGGGLGLGYLLGDKWSLDGRAAYSYYFDGEIRNSSNSGLVFDTNGTCLDAGIGVKREIAHNMSLYIGGSYTLIDLDESEVVDNFIFPDSRTQIMAGVVNVTYAF